MSPLKELLLWGLITLLSLFFGWKRGLFKLKSQQKAPNISLQNLLVAFTIYFGIGYFLVPYIFRFSNFYLSLFISSLLSLTALVFLFKKKLKEPHFLLKDVTIGALSWFIAFPITIFLSDLFELIFQDRDLTEQLVVLLFKSALNSPLNLLLIILLISILAPITEEILFRGIVQNYFKKVGGPQAAILITSLLFATIHFELRQGWSNVNTLTTTFFLSLLLGFIYERQHTLITPISLHICYNSFNIVYLLTIKDIS